jgi:hypothetical protein
MICAALSVAAAARRANPGTMLSDTPAAVAPVNNPNCRRVNENRLDFRSITLLLVG